MEGRILGNWRILAATLFAVVLVTGAYVVAQNAESPQVAQASGETALLQAIATKDSDNDGLPDWEESLYGTDSHIVDTFHLGMTDGEAVSRGLIVPKAIADIATASTTTGAAVAGITPPGQGTLTDAFAKKFLALYLTAKQENGGIALSRDETDALATQALSELSSLAPATDFKKAEDLRVSGTGSDALRAFAVAAEAVLKKNAVVSTKTDMQYLQDSLNAKANDTTDSHALVALAKMYRDSATGLAVLPVPTELAAAHLAIVNSLMRLSEIYSDFSRVNTDPLTAMLALEQYPQTELTAEKGFIAVATTYASAGISLAPGAPGAGFVNVMANITAEQKAK